VGNVKFHVQRTEEKHMPFPFLPPAQSGMQTAQNAEMRHEETRGEAVPRAPGATVSARPKRYSTFRYNLVFSHG